MSVKNGLTSVKDWQETKKRGEVKHTVSIFLDAAITAEESHPTDTDDALLQPLVLVLERLVHQGVCLDVAVEVVRDQVVVAVLHDTVAQRVEARRLAEHAPADGVEDFGQVRVQLEVAVLVGVAEILDVLGQIAEEEDIRLPDLTGDLDLEWVVSDCGIGKELRTVGIHICSVTGSNDETTIENELHVACP